MLQWDCDIRTWNSSSLAKEIFRISKSVTRVWNILVWLTKFISTDFYLDFFSASYKPIVSVQNDLTREIHVYHNLIQYPMCSEVKGILVPLVEFLVLMLLVSDYGVVFLVVKADIWQSCPLLISSQQQWGGRLEGIYVIMDRISCGTFMIRSDVNAAFLYCWFSIFTCNLNTALSVSDELSKTSKLNNSSEEYFTATG